MKFNLQTERYTYTEKDKAAHEELGFGFEKHGDRWSGVELTIIKDGIQITLTSDEVRELAGCMERVGGMANKKQKHSAPQSGL